MRRLEDNQDKMREEYQKQLETVKDEFAAITKTSMEEIEGHRKTIAELEEELERAKVSGEVEDAGKVLEQNKQLAEV